MRRSEFTYLKTALALAALIGANQSFSGMAFAALFVALAVLGTASFFSLTASLFPKKFLQPALFLWIAAFYQALSYFVPAPALYLVSFFLLFDWNDVDRNRLGPKTLPLVPRLVLFLGSALFLGAAQAYLSKRFGGADFKQPVRILTLLSLWAWALQRILPLRAGRKAA